MWGRSSDRQHDLTSARFLPSRTIRRSRCLSLTRFSQSSRHCTPVFAYTWRNEENRVAPTGVAQPVWLLAATPVRCTMPGPGGVQRDVCTRGRPLVELDENSCVHWRRSSRCIKCTDRFPGVRDGRAQLVRIEDE